MRCCRGENPIEAQDKESGGATLHLRPLLDGAALLYVFFSTHKESSLLCYAVDGKTGALALKGKGDQQRRRRWGNRRPPGKAG